MQQLSFLDSDRCLTCADTGHWQGEPQPCPECGVFVTRHAPDDLPSLRYVEKHSGPNRKDRRSRRKR